MPGTGDQLRGRGADVIGPVVILEPMAPALQDRVRAMAGDDLQLVFPASARPDECAVLVAGAEYLVLRGLPLPEHMLAGAGRLKLIHQWGTGIDGVPVEAARRRGIPVARCAGVNASTVADLTIGLMLAALRRIPQADAAVKAGGWRMDDLWELAFDLCDARVGLVGFGAIGRLVAQRLSGFGCEVAYSRPSGALAESPLRCEPLKTLLADADVVSLHLPLTPATRQIINRERLFSMKRGAVLINTSRGGLVDEPALVEALESGHLAAAGLDVFAEEPTAPDNPLLGLGNVVTLPHIGGRSRDNLRRMVGRWAGNIRAHAAGGAIPAKDLVA